MSVKSVKSTIMASNSKTCSLGPIPTSLLKDCIDFLAATVTYLVNASFSCGLFSSTLKHAAARITTRTKKYQHISPLLRKLHLLPVTKRLEFKILTMTYKALNGMAPSYICDLLQVHHPNRNLRSASRGLSLVVPAYQTQAYGARSFSVAAPTLWNSLPVDIKNAQSLSIFKKSLKTFLIN